MTVGIINPSGTASLKPPSAVVRALSWASPIRWAIRALVCSELQGMELEAGSLKDVPRMGGLALVRSGDEVLQRLGLEEETSVHCRRQLVRLLVAELVVAIGGLRLTRPRFQPMETPPTNATGTNQLARLSRVM
eukprot:gnl/MRDRNA2_/MRDRNA2_341955_c0_seq1.p1 gnl/MRDRNA2_/MRDRNA2_341955_c0~~gnl/MRDRNA2_/MRDRNA2_341955_c0_seq1.p1  ORF type:complete len:134 (+),score=17.39 gnl/MRDRNA2_/MRDRNA2_341955_c0_seq1:3-404(+)